MTVTLVMANHLLQLISWKHKPSPRRRSPLQRLVAQTPHPEAHRVSVCALSAQKLTGLGRLHLQLICSSSNRGGIPWMTSLGTNETSNSSGCHESGKTVLHVLKNNKKVPFFLLVSQTISLAGDCTRAPPIGVRGEWQSAFELWEEKKIIIRDFFFVMTKMLLNVVCLPTGEKENVVSRFSALFLHLGWLRHWGLVASKWILIFFFFLLSIGLELFNKLIKTDKTSLLAM